MGFFTFKISTRLKYPGTRELSFLLNAALKVIDLVSWDSKEIQLHKHNKDGQFCSDFSDTVYSFLLWED